MVSRKPSILNNASASCLLCLRVNHWICTLIIKVTKKRRACARWCQGASILAIAPITALGLLWTSFRSSCHIKALVMQHVVTDKYSFIFIVFDGVAVVLWL